MRDLPPEILAVINDHDYKAVHLLIIETGLHGSETYCWTDAPFSITYGGNEYQQQWFSVGDTVIDDAGNQAVQLVFPDVGQIVRGLLYNEDWSYRPATLREVWLDANRVAIEAFIVADGRADGGTANFEDASEPVTISIVPDSDAEGAPGPAQSHESSCRYVRQYKGLQCGYAGLLPTCAGTFTDCAAHSNTPRFGGFPYAPKPGTVLRVGEGATEVGSR
jgi:hypothetical protein